MITFPRSRVLQFYKENANWRDKGLRLGQAFHNYMELHKVTNADDKKFCDELHAAKSDIAGHMIIKHTDWNN